MSGSPLATLLLTAAWCHGSVGCDSEQGSRVARRANPRRATERAHTKEQRVDEASPGSDWAELRRWLRGENINVELGELMPESEEVAASRGQVLFRQHCSDCHGQEGLGNGQRADEFDPRPSDLTRGSFKFRSTQTGSVPTAEDLFATITRGLRGTGMLAFADLQEADRWALVAYVRRLSPRFAGAEIELAQLPDPPSDLGATDRIARGRRAFQVLGCPTCHGQNGRGDGLAAAWLTTDQGRAERAPDFVAWPLKHGDGVDALLRTLVTGLDGTPMPSYREAATDEQLRDLVAFVWWLRSPESGATTEPERQQVKQLIDRQYAKALRALGLSLTDVPDGSQ